MVIKKEPIKKETIITETKPKSKFLHYFSFLLFFSICVMSIFIYIHHDAITNDGINNSKKLKMFENQINDLEKKNKTQSNQPLSANGTSVGPDANLAQAGEEDDAPYKFVPANPNKFLSFDKLIGFKEELTACDGFLDYLKNKSNYEGIGDVEAPLGILMYGCPGTGKTTLARALAKETKLPFFEVSSSIFSQKYKGLAPQMVQDLFAAARKEAEAKENNGAIIFLDECETIFTDLGSLEAGSEIANVVNQFKTEMTSTENNPNKPIFVIGATNHIEQIDEAIKSRFTYNIEVKPGNREERQKMLKFLIEKRKNPYCVDSKNYLFNVINESLERLPQDQEFLKANRTLENLLKTTVSVFARNRGTGEDKRKAIQKEDLQQAYKMIISPNIDILNQIEKDLTSQSK
ncbi:AAA family ATPase [Candidatus Phytoplasma sp. AldY-WA1]|uniref:AAA family ATPase n=1 Tax=Candidatus Phytoplasma sp. AldY-WA1 TaxID=2852100 RepID=UPI00254CB20D|nr:AAA family ATPase [Candidatus Phytoplasma sp. AldY-WA1]